MNFCLGIKMKILFVLLVKYHFFGSSASPVSQLYDEYYDEEFDYDEYGGHPPPYIDPDLLGSLCELPPELDYTGEDFYLLPTTSFTTYVLIRCLIL